MQKILLVLLLSLPFVLTAQSREADSLKAESLIQNLPKTGEARAQGIQEIVALFRKHAIWSRYFLVRTDLIRENNEGLEDELSQFNALLEEMQEQPLTAKTWFGVYQSMSYSLIIKGANKEGLQLGAKTLAQIEQLPQPDPEMLIETHLRMATIQQWLQNKKRTIAHMEAAKRLLAPLPKNTFFYQTKHYLIYLHVFNGGLSADVRRTLSNESNGYLQKVAQALPKQSEDLRRMYNLQASLYMLGRRPYKCLAISHQLLEWSKETGNPGSLAAAYLDLGAIYKDMRLPKEWSREQRRLVNSHKNDSAILYHLAAAAIYENNPKLLDINRAQCYVNLGNLYARTNRADSALSYYNKAALVYVEGIDALNEDMTLDWEQRRYCVQERSLIDLQRRRGLTMLARWEETGDSVWLDRILAQMPLTDKIIQRYSRSLDDKALSVVAELRLRSMVIPLGSLIQATQGDEGQAAHSSLLFSTVETAINARMLGVLQSKGAARIGKVPADVLEEEAALRKKRAKVEHALLTAERAQNTQAVKEQADALLKLDQDYDEFVASLAARAPEYQQLKFQPQSIKLEELQAQLPAETAVLQYVYGQQERLWLFYITAERTLLFHQQGKEELDTKEGKQQFRKYLPKVLEDFRELLTQPQAIQERPEASVQRYQGTALELSRLLMLDKALQDPSIKNLIIIPDGQLHHIPFEALLSKDRPAAKNFAELNYLLKDYNMSYAYSSSLYHNSMHKAPKGGKGILGFAASYTQVEELPENRDAQVRSLRDRLTDLPGAKNELEGLQAKYPGDYYFGEAANEAQFKGSDKSAYSVIHLAMHGLLDAENPFASSLAFTENGDTIEDNFVFAYELTQMAIPSDLVVLSACETGFGKFQSGEGVASLARSFLYAGAPSLVVSLWSVSDLSTAQIMPLFYEGLNQGLSKPQALRQAKLKYLKEAKGISAHPFFWAPFVQLGNTEPIEIDSGWGYGPWLMGGGALLLLGGLGLWRRRRGKG